MAHCHPMSVGSVLSTPSAPTCLSSRNDRQQHGRPGNRRSMSSGWLRLTATAYDLYRQLSPTLAGPSRLAGARCCPCPVGRSDPLCGLCCCRLLRQPGPLNLYRNSSHGDAVGAGLALFVRSVVALEYLSHGLRKCYLGGCQCFAFFVRSKV